MTKEEYKSEMEGIMTSRTDLHRRELEIKRSYISEHRKFSIDDKVKVTYKDGYSTEAFIVGCGIHDNGDLYYSMKSVKKDGSKSSHRLPTRWEDKQSIELIEPAKP